MPTPDQYGPEEIIQVSDPKLGMTGFLVIDNTALGLGKGGIRMTPTVSAEEVARLARTMTWKNAIAGLPFGGAKAGIVWQPDKALTPEQQTQLKQQFVQSFAKALSPFLNKRYVAGPDVNSGETEMDWFASAVKDPKASTGKSQSQGGLPHELGSTGFGVSKATEAAADFLGLPLIGATVAIEGFGNVGQFAFKHLEAAGAKIVAVSDSRGTIYSPDGLIYSELSAFKNTGQSVTDFPEGQKLSTSELFSLPVDILIPAAVTDVINESNWEGIKAKLIVEGSNIPMTEEIENRLGQKGITVIPDFVANSGGVISSWAEYTDLDQAKMFDLITERIPEITTTVLTMSRDNKISPRKAALTIAQASVDTAMKARSETFSI